MKCSMLLLSCLFALISFVSASKSFGSAPLVMWSPQNNELSHIKSSDITSQADLEVILRTVISQRPNVVVAFIFSDMTSADLSNYLGAYAAEPNQYFPLLKSSISSSESAFIPFVQTSTPMSQLLTSVVSSNVFSAESCDEALNLIAENKQTLSNGQTSLIIVRVSRQGELSLVEKQDRCFGSVVHQVKELSNGNVVSMISSDATFSESKKQSDESLLEMNTLAVTTTKVLLPGVQYINSTILFGLIFFFIFLFMLWNGLSCLMSVQTPLRYPIRKLAINKEFN